MQEHEWLASLDPAAMLTWLTKPAGPANPRIYPSDRKLRLFACSCCRQVWDLLTDSRSRRAVEVAERFADGEATQIDLDAANQDARRCWRPENNADGFAVYCGHGNTRYAAERITRPGLSGVDSATQAALLRETSGNPFRLVGEWYRGGDGIEPLPPKWLYPLLTPTVVAIARRAYDARDWGATPVLADALEEAGCESEDLLRHLRNHVLCPACSLGDPIEKWYGGGGGWCAYCDQSGPDLHWIAAGELLPEHRHLHGPHVRGCWALDLILGKE